jgi:dTDP-4-dehydrorhamnose 3,5-epimerase
MKLITTPLKAVVIVEPDVFEDSRGLFMEVFHQKKYNDLGIDRIFVQDNLSYSIQGTLRGLHYQLNPGQGKLIQVIRGEIIDVAVDIRKGSPMFGQWISVSLSSNNRRQIYIPEGFAHGFCVISENADVMYKCTDFYAPCNERGIVWSDPDIAIDWPVKNPILSPKDRSYPLLRDVSSDNLPRYEDKK